MATSDPMTSGFVVTPDLTKNADPPTTGDVTVTSDPTRELVLFLLGKTGHGKSSTGNTVLGRHAFATSDDAESQTFITQSGWTRTETGGIVQVVDGPGVCETRLSRGDAAHKMVEDMSRGVLLCPGGFDALVIVCRYGIRFTEEEQQAVDALKAVFGQSFIRDFGLLIFTHGEELDLKNRKAKEKVTFEAWCRRQTGRLRELMDECEGRCLLFRNMDDDTAQTETLLDTVARMKARGVRYTQDMFQSIKASQEEYFIRENAEHLRADFRKKVGLLQDGLSRVLRLCDGEADKAALEAAMDSVQGDIHALRADIHNTDRGTGVLAELQATVDSLEMNLALRRAGLRDATRSDDLQREMVALKAQLSENEEKLIKAQKENDNKGADTFANVVKMIGETILRLAPTILKFLEVSASRGTASRAIRGPPRPINGGPIVQEPTSDEG